MHASNIRLKLCVLVLNILFVEQGFGIDSIHDNGTISELNFAAIKADCLCWLVGGHKSLCSVHCQLTECLHSMEYCSNVLTSWTRISVDKITNMEHGRNWFQSQSCSEVGWICPMGRHTTFFLNLCKTLFGGREAVGSDEKKTCVFI